jgi:dipeptidyl aminopeptidase/acylaminoacyl peptidase
MNRKFKTVKFYFLIFLIFFLCIKPDFGLQDKSLFSIQDLLNVKRVSDPQISPSGQWVACVVTQFEEHQLNSKIWIVSRDRKILHKLTENPGSDFSPRWSPSGDILAFLSRGDKERNSQIYFYSLRTKEVEKITDEPGSIHALKWSSDGGKIAFLMAEPLTEKERERIRRGDDARVVDEDYRHTQLWLLDVESRKSRLLNQQEKTVWLFNWSPDSKRIAVLASFLPTAEGNEYRSHLYLRDVESGQETLLSPKTNAQASPSFSPDGRWIVYLGPVGQFKERGIPKIIPVGGGRPTPLLKDYEGNVWDVAWHPKKMKILAALARGTRHYFVSFDQKEKIEFLFEMNYSIIPYWRNYWSVSADGDFVAFISETLSSPGEVWISSIDGKDRKQLTFFNHHLRKLKLGKVEEIKWINPKDNASVSGIIVKPAEFSPDNRYPLIVWLHGGPAYNWSLGIQSSNWAQLFASQGYLVFLPNFRGSSGQGMEWMMANVRDWGEGPMSDVMSGVDYLIDKECVDESRMFVGGGSYGGYLTFWIIAHTDRFSSAFARAGVVDLLTEYALTDEPSFMIGYFLKSPYEDPEIYRKNSPLTYASQVSTPVLIVHGEWDLRVPVSQAYELYSALKHYGAEVKLVIYPREPHGIGEYTHQVDVLNRVLHWFKSEGKNIDFP